MSRRRVGAHAGHRCRRACREADDHHHGVSRRGQGEGQGRRPGAIDWSFGLRGARLVEVWSSAGVRSAGPACIGDRFWPIRLEHEVGGTDLGLLHGSGGSPLQLHHRGAGTTKPLGELPARQRRGVARRRQELNFISHLLLEQQRSEKAASYTAVSVGIDALCDPARVHRARYGLATGHVPAADLATAQVGVGPLADHWRMTGPVYSGVLKKPTEPRSTICYDLGNTHL